MHCFMGPALCWQFIHLFSLFILEKGLKDKLLPLSHVDRYKDVSCHMRRSIRVVINVWGITGVDVGVYPKHTPISLLLLKTSLNCRMRDIGMA